MIDYRLTRSKRKTIAIYIRDGEVEVRAPLKAPLREIERFILLKAQWISKNLAGQQAQSEKHASFSLNYGSEIRLLGKPYTITPHKGARVVLGDGVCYFPSHLTPGKIKLKCINMYKKRAKIHITERAGYFSAQMGVVPAAIKISSAVKRWGSCSSKKSLNFSWRLMMADESVIDYVVVHELAHLREMNHSARFWAIVATVLPDYAQRKDQLRILSSQLLNENWG